MFNWPDTFSVVEMTDAVNKLPLMPLRFSGMFETYGLPTTHMAFDCKRGRIILISDSPRNADPEYVTGQTEKRETARTCPRPTHWPLKTCRTCGPLAPRSL